MTEQSLQRYAEQTQAKPPSAQRQKLIQDMIEVTNGLEFGARLMEGMALGVAIGMDSTQPVQNRAGVAMLRKQLEAAMPKEQVKAQLRAAMPAMMGYTYREVSDADLTAYVVFSAQPRRQARQRRDHRGIHPGDGLGERAHGAVRGPAQHEAAHLAPRLQPDDGIFTLSGVSPSWYTSPNNEQGAAGARMSLERKVKAAFFRSYGGPEVLEYGELPDPVPAAGEVLVEVHAASVNAADWKMRAGQYGAAVGFPHVPGRDFSGVVAALGKGASDFKVGDAVWGVCEVPREGAYAGEDRDRQEIVARLPAKLRTRSARRWRSPA
jgi:hypothetical protein